MENMKIRKRLRTLIEGSEMLIAPGCNDAFSAKIAQACGFEAVYMTGFGTVATVYGLPDIGLATMTEMVENARRIADSVSIPVIADADTGYGNHLNVIRTVQEYERAGVAGMQLEDQVSPKRCGHMNGQQVVPAEEMVTKIRAGIDTRKDENFLIIARTDAISAVNFDEAIERGNMYGEAGADIIFVEAPRSIEEMQSIPKLIKNVPVMVNIAPKTPYLNAGEYENMGFALAIYPAVSITNAYRAIKEDMMELKMTGMMKNGSHGGVPFEELSDFLGVKHYRKLEEELLEDNTK